MNEERNDRICRFLKEYVNFGDSPVCEGQLVVAVRLLQKSRVFSFEELRREFLRKVLAFIPSDWEEELPDE